MSQTFSTDNSADVFGSDPGPRPSPAPQKRAGRSFLRDNLLLIAMPLISAAVLYGLSLRGGPSSASAQSVRNEQQVDSVITSLSAVTGEVSKVKTQTILDNFYHEARQRQIPLDKVKGNPFVFNIKAPVDSASGTGAQNTVVIIPAQAPVNVELDAARNALKQLNLQSVLTGGSGRPIATISNNLLTEGQVISGWTVFKIDPTEVTLKWKDQTHVLRMAE